MKKDKTKNRTDKANKRPAASVFFFVLYGKSVPDVVKDKPELIWGKMPNSVRWHLWFWRSSQINLLSLPHCNFSHRLWKSWETRRRKLGRHKVIKNTPWTAVESVPQKHIYSCAKSKVGLACRMFKGRRKKRNWMIKIVALPYSLLHFFFANFFMQVLKYVLT